MTRLQIPAFGKNVHCVKVMSVALVFFSFLNYTIFLLTCYDCLVRKWTRLTFERESTFDSFYWILYPESFQLDFLWRKMVIMVDYSLNL